MLVVTTPTGQIGSQLLTKLTAASAPIRAIARDSASIAPAIRDRIDIVEGSHTNPTTATAAFAGADAIFLLTPPDTQTDDLEDYYLRCSQAAASAIAAGSKTRLVAVSTLGQDYTKNAGHLSAALRAEEPLIKAFSNVRVLRMPFFMENLLSQADSISKSGMFFLPNVGDRELLTVATTDIASAAAELLLDNTWTGHGSVPVIGPDHLTPVGMAEVMSDVLERPIQFQQVTLDDYKATMSQYGVSQAWADGLADMAAAQNDRIYQPEASKTHMLAPTSFQHWCDQTLRVALQA